MQPVMAASPRGRRVLRATLAMAAAGLCVFVSSGWAVAEPAPMSVAPSGVAASVASFGSAAGELQPPAFNGLIDSGLLESLQPSIVGLVTIWEEPEDPFAMVVPEPVASAASPQLPVMAICTGWFDSPTTIATAGHCVDPKEGRLAMHLQDGPVDPETGWPLPPDPSLPEPKRTVWAFQPRELPGAVLTSPVIVRVHSFHTAEDGDTAKLEVHGLPPAQPLAIASDAPRLGDTVTSIGFPGLNISETDGINLEALLSSGKSPAEVLQDSRLQPANTSGTIISRQYRDGVPVYQVNADFDQGESGGPTVNSGGQVLGINSQMTVPFIGQNFNVITDTGMLRQALGHDQPQHVPPADSAAVETASEISVQPGRAVTPDTAALTGWAIGLLGAGVGGALFGALVIRGMDSFRRGTLAARSADTTDTQHPKPAAPLP